MDAKLESEIISYIENNQPEVYWDYRDELSKEQIEKLLESEEALFDIANELWEYNLDYICQMESQLIADIQKEFDLEDEDIDELEDKFRDYIHVDLNFDYLLKNTGDIVAMVVMYSNYDCATSMSDVEEPESYLNDVFHRLRGAVKKDDFVWEASQVYGGSLLVFPFKCSIKEFLEFKKNFKNSVTIPVGSQFGFFSSFVGSGSPFERHTTKQVVLPKLEPEMTKYDCVDIIADIQQSYSMADVYGGTDFVEDSKIKVE